MFQLLLYKLTGNEQHLDPVNELLNFWFPGGDIHYTPGGLAWVDMWGPCRYSGIIFSSRFCFTYAHSASQNVFFFRFFSSAFFISFFFNTDKKVKITKRVKCQPANNHKFTVVDNIKLIPEKNRNIFPKYMDI